MKPQLRMVHTLVGLPPQRLLPDGYVLRHAGPDDADGIASVLARAFDEPWDGARVNSELLANEDVPTSFVIASQATIVGTASYQLKEPFPASSWLHWVGVDPDHRGLGLGYHLGLAVLEHSHREQRDSVLLSTDDFRLGAIKTYWRLGFEPDPCHSSHEERWLRVMAELGIQMPIRNV
jgi:mycothiol synthase